MSQPVVLHSFVKIGIDSTEWVERAERVLENRLHTFRDPNLFIMSLLFSVMNQLAGGGFFKAESDLCCGRFSTATFAGQGKNFGWFDVKADVVYGGKGNPGKHSTLGIPLGQVVDLKHFVHFVPPQLTSRRL